MWTEAVFLATDPSTEPWVKQQLAKHQIDFIVSNMPSKHVFFLAWGQLLRGRWMCNICSCFSSSTSPLRAWSIRTHRMSANAVRAHFGRMICGWHRFTARTFHSRTSWVAKLKVKHGLTILTMNWKHDMRGQKLPFLLRRFRSLGTAMILLGDGAHSLLV